MLYVGLRRPCELALFSQGPFATGERGGIVHNSKLASGCSQVSLLFKPHRRYELAYIELDLVWPSCPPLNIAQTIASFHSSGTLLIQV